MCFPKAEGGLGLRRIRLWNTTLCLKLVWLLFSASGSLWVAWHHHHYLKGKSFWSLKPNTRNSWTWNSLLNLRDIAEDFIVCKVGNGLTASFWFDSWTPFGPLIKFLGEDGPRDLRLPIHALVSDCCDDIGWKLVSPRTAGATALNAYLLATSTPLGITTKDQYSWIIGDTKLQKFPASLTWEELREKAPLRDWVSSVWFKGSTPRNAFHMWVAQLDRLPTRTRLSSWDLSITPICCLCSEHNETRDHLLLRCVFSQQIWNLIQARLHLQPCIFYTWHTLIAWTNLRSVSAPSTLRKVVAQAAVYHIWKQRNNLLHNQVSLPLMSIFKDIDREVRNTISARRSRKLFKNLMIRWIR